MPSFFVFVVQSIASIFRSRTALQIEVMALRHQLVVYRRAGRRPRRARTRAQDARPLVTLCLSRTQPLRRQCGSRHAQDAHTIDEVACRQVRIVRRRRLGPTVKPVRDGEGRGPVRTVDIRPSRQAQLQRLGPDRHAQTAKKPIGASTSAPAATLDGDTCAGADERRVRVDAAVDTDADTYPYLRADTSAHVAVASTRHVGGRVFPN